MWATVSRVAPRSARRRALPADVALPQDHVALTVFCRPPRGPAGPSLPARSRCCAGVFCRPAAPNPGPGPYIRARWRGEGHLPDAAAASPGASRGRGRTDSAGAQVDGAVHGGGQGVAVSGRSSVGKVPCPRGLGGWVRGENKPVCPKSASNFGPLLSIPFVPSEKS